MAKDPAFLFYSQDFYTGVATLNWEDRGKYISILCLMHQQGRMSEETIRFIVGSVSDNLRSKFSIDDNGLWYNERLETESEKRSKFTESRRLNGLEGGRPKSKVEHIKPQDQWSEMIRYFDNSCLCCGYKFPENERPTKDHVVPTACGGPDVISNWQPLCRECNSSKGAQSSVDYRVKYKEKIPKKYLTIWFAKANLMEDENENEIKDINTKERVDFFLEVKNVGGDIYTDEMIKRFSEYWTEPIVKGKDLGKERWQGEKTWKLTQRLSKWAERNLDGIVCYREDDKSIKDKKIAFKNVLRPFLEVYPKDMINAFLLHWSQPENIKHPKKLKWELEDSWELKTRLTSWKAREDARQDPIKKDEKYRITPNSYQNG